MKLKDLFHKKEVVSESAQIAEEIQKVDLWLQLEAPVYHLHFDTTVPLQPARAKYLEAAELEEKFKIYNKKLKKYINEHLCDVGDKYSLYDIYQYIKMALTTTFQMIIFAPSSVIRTFVNFNEAVSYFDNVFLKTEELCKIIVYNMEQIELEILETMGLDKEYRKKEREEFVLYENGIRKLKYCKELEQCEQLLKMLAECTRYGDYLFSIAFYIYENVPFIMDDEGNYKIIKDWEKTKENISRHVNMANKEHGITTADDFINLVE